MERTYTMKSKSEELLQSQTQLWAHIFNFIDSMSLKCAVELGIPEAIHDHGKPIPLSELLSVLSISSAKRSELRRLMCLLVHLGIFECSNIDGNNEMEDVYSLTPISSLLVEKDVDANLSGFILAVLQPIVLNPFVSMSAWFKLLDDKATPFSMEHGCGLWDLTRHAPKINNMFNNGMVSDTKFLMGVLLKDYRHVFEGINSLVDVGGGTGSTAMAISCAFPNIKCSVLDLPQVVDSVSNKGAIDFVAGDMFEYIPPTDVVLLKWILHDWKDEDCMKILRRCREAIACEDGRGKVIIIDLVVGSNTSSTSQNSTQTQLYFDILMLVQFGGKERRESEWSKIFTESGFRTYKIIPLGLRSIIELYP